MSTINTELPDRVETGQTSGSWRISQGKLLRGREGSEESRDALLGRLKRITAFYGTLDDGRDYGKLEAELECRNGLQTVTTVLRNPDSGKPTLSSSISFAEGLLECAAGELIQIEAVQGKKQNRYGKLSTYARVTRIDPVILNPLPSPRRDRAGAFDEDYLDSLIDRLKDHPAYGDRPQREPSGPTHLSELEGEMMLRGWPAPSQAPSEWCAMLSKFKELGRPITALTDLSDHEWGLVRLQLKQAVKIPKALESVKLPEEFDPFA